MKKLLALVLALVMSMSLVTISNAAFKDADKIDYKEAVDVMNAIGVFVGDENGNFNAKENLTREQAAKIIAYLELGDKTADALVGSNIFTDVASTRWSAGFIGYCAQAGVVNGVGDSKFNPTGALTALQFGKMLLVELGYDAKAEKMEGIDWAINTSKLMAKAKLMDGIDGSVNQVITREQAAKMSLNALKAPTVVYDTKGSSVTVNGAEINFGASEAKYNTSDVAADQNISEKKLTSGEYTVELGEKLYPKLVLVDGDYAEAYDAFLRPADTWYYKNQKIGTYAWTPDLTYTKSVSASELYMDLGISTVANGKKASYVAVDGVRNATQESYLIQKSNTTDKFGGNGVLTEVYKDDNFVYIVEINTYVGDVSAVSAGTKTQNAYVTIANRGNGTSGTYETTDFAVDDVVLYTYSYKLDGAKYEGIQSVTKAAAKITGNLSEVTLGKNATVGSTKYDFSKKIANVADTTMLKYDVDVILDSYGYAIDIQPTNTNTAYAYVLNVKANAGDFNSTAKAELLFTDGTTQVVSLNNNADVLADKVYTKGTNSAGTNSVNVLTVGDIVKYQVNNADKYTLERVAQLNAEAVNALADNARTQASGVDKTKTSNGGYSFKANGVDYTANGKTLFLVATKNGTGTVYTVYEGIKNVPSITTSAAVNSAVYVENGVAKIVFIDARENALVSSSTVIFLKPNSTMTATTNSKLGTYYTYSEAIVNGEKVENFKVAADSFTAMAAARGVNNVDVARAGGMFTAVAYDDNQIATVSSYITAVTGTGKYYNKTVTIAGSAYTYTDDVNVWYLDTNDVLTKVTATAVADDANDTVYVKMNAGNEITDIVIIEVENEIPSNDASIKSITVKGQALKASTETDVDYEVALSYAVNHSSAANIEYTLGNNNATVSYVGGTALNALGNGAGWTAHMKSNHSFGDAVSYVQVTVTSQDTTNHTDLVIKIVSETAPLTLTADAGITAVTNAALPAKTGTITVTSGKVGELVDAIKAQLTDATGVCIKGTNTYGALSVLADDKTVASNNVLYATSAFGTEYTWTITVS